ncbi:MAG TPA: HD domain-containing phosphohydrolase [Thermoanaerobaculia bacterium]|nr:HD domain-containing phosphohydrolase [Thermoanaerobaculia bacterium]
MNKQPVPRRLRLFVLLSGALVLASLVPLLISDTALIRRNRRALEVLEEKYLTRSSSALADRISAYHASAREELANAANSVRMARELTGENPFTSRNGPEILRAVLRGETPLLALRGVNRKGIGSFAGPASLPAEVEFELRRAFESARDGAFYSGDPFEAPPLGAVSVLASPVADEDGLIGVVEAVVSWEPIRREFADETRRDVRATLVDREGRILFPPAIRGGEQRHASSLVADFQRFPARVTRSETRAGVTVLASIAPVGQPAWAVLLERDRDAAFASVDRMIRDTVLWSAAALLGALLLGVVFARRLSRPIAQLAESTRAVSEGQYDTRVEVRGTAELADLSENFNRMSESISTAVNNLKRAARENHELFINSIRALAAAIDAKDPYTRGHSERVARYSSLVAKEMGLPSEDVRRVRLSALLHDVGKIGIDDRIIRKPTALTEEEFEIMKSHPVKGAAIMDAIPELHDVIPGMKHHHERWEGGGYPDGLVGEEIPLQARIVSVADTFDAMTTTRPYQQAMDLRFVFQRLRDLAGNRFDPQVVDALIRSYDKGELVPIAREEAPPEAPMPLRRVEAS